MPSYGYPLAVVAFALGFALALCGTAGAQSGAAAPTTADASLFADVAPEAPVSSDPEPASGAAVTDATSDWREILPGLTVGSQLRFRTESRRNARFDPARAGNDEDYLLSRLRVDLTWEPGDWVTGFVELQDARMLGEEAISDTRTPNIFADRLDVHQAYLDVGLPESGPLPISLRIGRQKLVYGSQRMVSPLEWVNTAQVFDGARIRIEAGAGRKLDAFATRLVPVSPTRLNDHGPSASRMLNSQLHGAYYTDTSLVAGARIEGYWLLRREARLDDAVHTIGTRIDAGYGAWAIDGEFASQAGRHGGMPQRAALVHVGGSFTTGLPGRPKVGAAFNYGSGDDDPTDGVHRTFDQLYPLGHAYYGYIDLFALQNLRNTEVTVETALPGRMTLRAGVQDFALVAPDADASYHVGGAVVHRADGANLSSHVGNEIDVTLRVPLGQVALEVGLWPLLRRRLPAGRRLRAADGGRSLRADDGRVLKPRDGERAPAGRDALQAGVALHPRVALAMWKGVLVGWCRRRVDDAHRFSRVVCCAGVRCRVSGGRAG